MAATAALVLVFGLVALPLCAATVAAVGSSSACHRPLFFSSTAGYTARMAHILLNLSCILLREILIFVSFNNVIVRL